MRKIILTAAAGALLAVTASLTAGPASAATSTRTASTTSCDQVLFVGARGSSEMGPGDYGWNSSRTPGDEYGLGPEVNSARNEVLKQFAGDETMQTESVSYQANSVLTLLRAPNLYFSNLGKGVTATMSLLKAQAEKCPGQVIILAGYSQGAMVMHRVLHDLINDESDFPILARVYADILIADGDQVPYDNEVLYGTAGEGANGIGHLDAKISKSSEAKFPANLGIIPIRVCNHHDPVCDATENDLDLFSINIHTSYAGTKPVLDAADAAAWRVLNTVCGVINPYVAENGC